jgi:beta-lactam-binding protein with PASTA domain
LVWTAVALGTAIIGGLLVSFVLFPTSIVRDEVEVPSLRGVATDQAISALAAVGLRGRLAGELADPLTPSGTISWQSPVAGTALPESSIVRLGVSTGAPRVLMPELIDLTVDAASRVLTASGLRIGRIDSVFAAAESGVLLGTRPEARQPIRAGSSVELIVSRGPRNRQ